MMTTDDTPPVKTFAHQIVLCASVVVAAHHSLHGTKPSRHALSYLACDGFLVYTDPPAPLFQL